MQDQSLWTKSGLFFFYFFILAGEGGGEGVAGYKEERGEEGEGFNLMAYRKKPIDQECPFVPLFLYLSRLKGKAEVWGI